MTRKRAAVVAALVLAAAGMAACGQTPFVADQTIHVLTPAPLATVSAPFVVSWTGAGLSDNRFAVFVDRTPIAPGHSLRDLATDQCKRQPGCPGDVYLAGLGVFLTDSDRVTVPVLQPLAGGTASRQAHPVRTLTLVVMDAQGRRVGDSAWQVEFRG